MIQNVALCTKIGDGVFQQDPSIGSHNRFRMELKANGFEFSAVKGHAQISVGCQHLHLFWQILYNQGMVSCNLHRIWKILEADCPAMVYHGTFAVDDFTAGGHPAS